MKALKIFFIAFVGVFFSTAAIAQSADHNPRKANVEGVAKVETVTDANKAPMAEPAADALQEPKAPAQATDKDKNKSAKKSCCSKDKEKATTGCGKKD